MTRSSTIFGVALSLSAFLITQTSGRNQELTIYNEPGQRGDSHVFRTKHSNLTEWKFFLNETSSFCVTGLWVFYDLDNYNYNSDSFYQNSNIENCGDFRDFGTYNSVRFLGPTNFKTPAISLYQGSGALATGGKELVVTSAESNLNFRPVRVYSFGNSSWTLFTGKDFDGDSFCFLPQGYSGTFVYTGLLQFNETFTVQSVVQGCGELEVKNNIDVYRNTEDQIWF